uniref:Uncharacterized protein n=1 Tax=Zea mays TaxID=4577 RepID=C4J8B7_MAIZE|nr:unknown [Zea mays]
MIWFGTMMETGQRVPASARSTPGLAS